MNTINEKRQYEMQILRENGCTLQSIGNIYHITRERVRQILKTDYAKQLERREEKKDNTFLLSNRYPQLKTLEGRDYNREIVRIRDNFTCQLCGKIWIKGRKFDVHHLDCIKEKTQQYDKPEEFSNMITLCHKCHLNIPAHRKSMERPIK
jgi:predicted transcriptional regulator